MARYKLLIDCGMTMCCRLADRRSIKTDKHVEVAGYWLCVWQVVRHRGIFTQQKALRHWYDAEREAISVSTCKFCALWSLPGRFGFWRDLLVSSSPHWRFAIEDHLVFCGSPRQSLHFLNNSLSLFLFVIQSWLCCNLH